MLKVYRIVLQPILISLFICTMLGCATPSDRASSKNTYHFTAIDYGTFTEILPDSAALHLKSIHFQIINNPFNHAYNLYSYENYTLKYRFSHCYKNARELFYIGNMAGDIAQVFVESNVQEPRAFNLYNPEQKEAITLTSKSYYKATFDFRGDTIAYDNQVIEVPTQADKKSSAIKQTIANHNKSSSSNSLKIVKGNNGYVLRSYLADYQKNMRDASHLDLAKYQYASDVIVRTNGDSLFINSHNKVWKTTNTSRTTTTIKTDAIGNPLELREARDLSHDQYTKNDYIDWITDIEYNALQLLSRKTRSKEIDKSGDKEFYDQTDYSYRFYLSDKGFLKVETYHSTDSANQKLYATIIFDENGNWVKVKKARDEVVRGIVYR